MLQSQSKSLVTFTSKMEINIANWKVLLIAKINVNIDKKKIVDLKVTRDYGLITYAKFLAKVKELLNL